MAKSARQGGRGSAGRSNGSVAPVAEPSDEAGGEARASRLRKRQRIATPSPPLSENEAERDDSDVEEVEGPGGREDAPPGPDAGERARARFIAIARRRAAHFAHFADDEAGEGRAEMREGEAEAGASVAPPAEAWPGPFSTAIKLVQDRAAAAAARADALANDGKKATAAPIVDWKPSRSLGEMLSGRLCPLRIPTLFAMCTRLVTDHVEYVESMDGVPDVVRRNLSALICQRRKMDAPTLKLLIAGASTEISVKDCSLVTEAEMLEALATCELGRLEALELGMCGRCVSDTVISASLAVGPASLPALQTLTLQGAYRLSNNGLSSLAAAAPGLKSIDLQSCCLVTEEGVRALADATGSNLLSLSLHGCTQLDGSRLIPALTPLKTLQTLSLAHVGGITAPVLSNLLLALGSSLLDLDLSDCSVLTDEGIAAVGVFCLGLQSLCLDHLTLLTDVSLGRLAESCPGLRSLSLKRGHFR